MTKRERVRQAISHDHDHDAADDLDSLLALAYWMGREDAAKIAGDKITVHLAAQRQRANSCRYYHLANRIVGCEQTIYLDNYDGDYSAAFGDDPTTL